ncbi:hypothetical protein GR160_15715 [Flavobacterium sp. Sd200]|uniref:hypothetical protein n=1 Tax=Flavobacterium sp. Sd200 TaxID=2692211 RepID=UPI001370BABC|nr:hypothetical protein [Flavobacterium sp. Sd200]MXN92676.1 hypothetical protein [Flavobacterium sp. Sd200]
MKYFKILFFVGMALCVLSCGNDEEQRIAETKRAKKQNDSIIKVISDNWRFDVPAPTQKVAERITSWNEWAQFNTELRQKPAGTAKNAYLQKTKTLVKRADLLKNNIPMFFNKPQVRSRMGVLITKIKSLYTYMSIETIPAKKVIAIIGEITHEMDALQNQLDEIVRISEIPKEQGEEEMLRALDTTRMANPDAMMPKLDQPQDNEPKPWQKPAPTQPQASPAGNGTSIKQKN